MAKSTSRKALAQKQQPSRTHLSRASKRRKLTDSTSAPASLSAPDTTSQASNSFLNLPREIRDQIYEKLLGNAKMEFRWDKILLRATPIGNYSNRLWNRRSVHGGLPLCMPTCEQMRYEVLEVIARTYSFGAINLLSDVEGKHDEPPNSLIISENVIRNIEIQASVDSHYASAYRNLQPWRVAGPDRFLERLELLNLNNLCLQLYWSRIHPNGRCGTNESKIYSEEWESQWKGRFRKVQVQVNVFDISPDKNGGDMWLMEEAEKCAKRLVRAGATVSRRNLSRIFGPDPWTRVVTVERKI